MNVVSPQTPEKVMCRDIVFPNDTSILRGKLLRQLKNDTYLGKESEAAMRLVRPGDTVLEIGAGVGLLSALIARHRRPRQVIAFEPNPVLVPYVRRLYLSNEIENAHVENAVIRAETGARVPFYLRHDCMASSLDGSQDAAFITGTEQVDVIGLNDVVAAIAPDVVILDLDSPDDMALSSTDLTDVNAVIVRMAPRLLGKDGIQQVFDSAARAGLTYWPRGSEGRVVSFLRGW